MLISPFGTTAPHKFSSSSESRLGYYRPVAKESFLNGYSSSFTQHVCSLKICTLAKITLKKALKNHRWNLNTKSQISGSEKTPPQPTEGEDKSKTVENSNAKPTVITTKVLSLSTEISLDQALNGGPSLCIAVIGATGELARNKVFPALFALYYSGHLPENVGIFGYSRKNMNDMDLRDMIAGTLTCRVDHHENCEDKLDKFLAQTYYINGGYNNRDGMAKLNSKMEQIEGGNGVNRIFYLSVPQEALADVAVSLADVAQTQKGWNRIIIEKPFGFDAVSSRKITQFLQSKIQESQIYRIDHLLGKDLIENLTVLRFSNLVFEPLWGRTYIRNVQVIFSQECGIEARGRYFDGYGTLRDIVHSHILQTIALFAMEPPVSLDGEDIRNEKVKVLRSIRKLNLEDVVLGQLKDESVKAENYMKSLTPTFFAAVLYIENARWDGVPFLIKTGMGLIKNRVEIRIQFRHVPGSLYREKFGQNIDLDTNELILRDEPEEAILLKVNNKVPGLGLKLDASQLNLLYRDRYDVEVPDSYEHLLLDVIDGDNHLFMRSDEVAAAWDILSPVIHEIDERKVTPELYEAGGRGPVGAYYLGAKHGVRWADD
ncbi:hypothetical protein LUZ60_013242 [Juncus effusus]|nr:hypothetical protein LUZ60_013242 [Juncus effusus]